MTKKIAKLEFVDGSKYDNGVLVAIENQQVTVAVKPNAALDKDALYTAIKAGGYKPLKIFELLPNGELKAYQP